MSDDWSEHGDALHDGLDAFAALIDLCAGYRERAKAAGFSDEAAEAMAVQAHEVMMHKAGQR